jgi:hypothetical protein
VLGDIRQPHEDTYHVFPSICGIVRGATKQNNKIIKVKRQLPGRSNREKGEGGNRIRKSNSRVNMSKVHNTHASKCHDETPHYVHLNVTN